MTIKREKSPSPGPTKVGSENLESEWSHLGGAGLPLYLHAGSGASHFSSEVASVHVNGNQRVIHFRKWGSVRSTAFWELLKRRSCPVDGREDLMNKPTSSKLEIELLEQSHGLDMHRMVFKYCRIRLSQSENVNLTRWEKKMRELTL